MKSKKGFAFIESVIVLVMVALSITMVYSSFSLISSKLKEKEYYDKASDKYLLLSVSSLGTNEKCNYTDTESCEIEGINFQANEDNCTETRMGKILYNCEKVFEDMDMKYLYVVDDINKELESSDALDKYDNGVIEYMKTLKKCSDKECTEPISYMIGEFYRGGNYYYASIEIEESETKKVYKITLNKEEGIGGSERVEVLKGELLPKISVPSKEGLTFDGYYTQRNGLGTKYYDSKGKPLKVYEEDSDITLYANWEVYKNLVIKKNNEEINSIQLGKNTTTTIEKESGFNIISCNNGIKISEENEQIKLDNILVNNSICNFSNDLSDIANNLDDTENNIVLLNDLNLDKQIIINKPLTIDTNGKSIEGHAIVNNSNLTIKNSSDVSSTISSPGSVLVNNENNTLNLENIKVISSSTSGGGSTIAIMEN